MGGSEYYGEARRAFDRALELDSTLIEPRVRMTYIYLIEGNSEVARQEIRRLSRRVPNEPSVHQAASYVYRLSGEYDRALDAWDRLLKISPTDVVVASYNRARIRIYQHDYGKAEAEIRKGMAFEPHHPLLRAFEAVIDYYKGEIEKATIELEDVLSKNPDIHGYKVFLAFCYLARGDRDRAFALVDDLVIATGYADQDAAYRLATLYALDGQAGEAIKWLEHSISTGNENYPWFITNPNWDQMREEPRFKALMEKLREKWEKLVESE
jgi:serine/threonine-protein kinase